MKAGFLERRVSILWLMYSITEDGGLSRSGYGICAWTPSVFFRRPKHSLESQWAVFVWTTRVSA